jgi:hypothetical protein
LTEFDAHWNCLENNNQVRLLYPPLSLASLFSRIDFGRCLNRNSTSVENPKEHSMIVSSPISNSVKRFQVLQLVSLKFTINCHPFMELFRNNRDLIFIGFLFAVESSLFVYEAMKASRNSWGRRRIEMELERVRGGNDQSKRKHKI